MSTVFVAGGTGYIGAPLISLLLAHRHKVVALARSGSEGKLPSGCSFVVGHALAESAKVIKGNK